tara:strand:+ start:944 stop:1366 length:423 start_codon:yes stop_codon:yes gene_type:complete
MENRIEINGVWYVREDASTDPLDHSEAEVLDLIFSEECCYETINYCFVASRIKRDEGDEFYPDEFNDEFYPDVNITFTDKRSGDIDTWKEEYWDNNNWFAGILEGNPESIKSLDDEIGLCKEGKKQFKGFLNRLVEEGWI